MKMTQAMTFATAAALLFSSCREDRQSPQFKWSENYIAGKIIPVKTPDNYTPYFLKLDDEGKGELTMISKTFTGTYDITNGVLTFKNDAKERWMIFTLEGDHVKDAKYEVRFKYKDDGTYEPAPVKYSATYFQYKYPSKNIYSGNTYMGDLYKTFYSGVFSKGWIVQFPGGKNVYDSGDAKEIPYTYQNNVAFRSEQSTGRKEIGVVIDGKLVLAWSDPKGFTYSGTLDKK